MSIVITVLDEAGSIDALLGSLLAQTAPFDEIVVVDGGSRDGTLQALEALAAREPRVKVHVEPGANISRGRNVAIAKARGEIVAVTDGGCRPEPTWLAELLRPLLADPAVGAVGGQFVAAPESRFEHYCGLLSTPDLAGESQREMFYGRSSAFRRSVWQAAGGYPEWLYTGEDTLFALRVQQLGGWRVLYAPASVVHWRPRPSLRKMARMFYLYGRGNGHIGNGSVAGSIYWLRYHAAFGLGLVLALLSPWWLLLCAAAGWPLWRGVVQPNLARAAQAPGAAADRWWYVPAIALARNLATNAGYLRGRLEYRRRDEFQRRHKAYVDGNGSHA